MRRIPAVDLARGLVMVIMAIDHTREYVNADAIAFRADDVTRTTMALFLTRWITHICAPSFMALAGLGAWFRLSRGDSPAAVSRYLFTRGFWLILLEFTIVRLVFFFQVGVDPTFLLVFWALGCCMIALAALIHLPWRWLLAVSVAMIALHNLTDRVAASAFGSFAWLWKILHQQTILFTEPFVVIVSYPLVPWIGVMALGFCAGRVYQWESDRRRRFLLMTGLVMIAGFVLLRTWNIYGDPRHWAPQPSWSMSIASFLNATKYPASLQFLLMTLGPLCLILAAFDRLKPSERNPFLVFGRAPLFYFVGHFAVIHATQIAMTAIRYGYAPFLFTPPPTIGGQRDAFPADFGWSLGVTYLTTLFVVIVMYPLCLWYLRRRSRRARSPERSEGAERRDGRLGVGPQPN